MNCQDFEQIIGDLARRRPIDAGARAEALAHEQACARCAARLSDERSLSAGLRALAATMKEHEAPARAEASLLAAFRARAAEAGHTAAPTTPVPAAPLQTEAAPAGVLPFARPRAEKLWSWKKTLATAATAAAAAAVALAVFVPRESTTRSKAGPVAVASNSPAGPASTGNAAPGGAQLNIRQHDARDNSDTQTVDDDHAVTTRGLGQRQPVRAPIMYASTNAPAPRRPSSARTAPAPAPEVTTEFFPLAHGGGLASGEGGQVVRVELPRTALASFGLPVNADTAGGRVRADVLFGEDGTARAIRFVR